MLERLNAGRPAARRITLFHFVLSAIGVALTEFPRLNRFVAGSRLYDRRGIWVSGGCEGLFEYQGVRPQPLPAPGGNIITCESRNYQQSWCNTGRRVGRAWVAEQRSQSPCIQGQTWGWRDNAIWVNGGCSAIFAFDSR